MIASFNVKHVKHSKKLSRQESNMVTLLISLVIFVTQHQLEGMQLAVSLQGLPLGTNGRLCSVSVLSVTLCGSEAWQVKQEDVIRKMQGWLNEYAIFSLWKGVLLKTSLKLNSMSKCLQDRKLQWFGHLSSRKNGRECLIQ